MSNPIESKIFSWKGWDQSDATSFLYYDVEFKRDFGSFKKGDKVKCLSLDLEESLLTEFDEDGGILRSVRVELRPI